MAVMVTGNTPVEDIFKTTFRPENPRCGASHRYRWLWHFGEFLDPIAYAIQRLNHIEVDVASLEFLAQPLDVAIDVIRSSTYTCSS